MAYDPPYNLAVGADGVISSTGAAQLAVQGAAGRKGFTIMNVGANNMGFSWRVANPVIGGAGTYTLLPAGSWTTPLNFCPAGPIYVVGTAGDRWTLDIWS